MELRIPAHFDFSELQLTYNPVTDELSYNVKLLSDMLTFKTDEDITLLDEPFLWGILLTLYRYHLDHGGQPDELIQQFLDALGKDAMKSHSGIEKNQSD